MSGFDTAKVDEEFFGAGKECEGFEQEFFRRYVKSNFYVTRLRRRVKLFHVHGCHLRKHPHFCDADK